MSDSQFEPRLARLFPSAWLAVAGTTRTRPSRPIQFTPSRVEPVPPPPSSPETRRSVASRVAQLGVWLLIAAGWLVFGAWWAIVLEHESVEALTYALRVLASIVVVCAVGMMLWTRYNLRIARNGKRGHASLYIPMTWERDALGRPIDRPGLDLARTAADVRLVVRDGVKVYVASREAK